MKMSDADQFVLCVASSKGPLDLLIMQAITTGCCVYALPHNVEVLCSSDTQETQNSHTQLSTSPQFILDNLPKPEITQ